MKKLITIISAFLIFSAFTTLDSVWKNDKPHSQLGFTITHLGISEVSGTFNDFDVNITASRPDFSDAVFELTAKVASVDTRIEARNNHLKSADFFDAEKYPTLNFKSTSLVKTSNNTYELNGDLTLHGITKPVTMHLQYNGQVENPMSKKQTAGFKLTGVIKRSDYSLGNGFPAPMLSDEVQIKADGEFIQ